MAFRPIDLDCLTVVVSPLISVYDRGRELERHLSMELLNPMLERATSTKHLANMVTREIVAFNVGIPFRLLFVDGADGTETDPEWATHPIMMVSHHSPDGDFLVTPQ